MKIIVYGINYAPELTGIGKYTTELCEWLAERGHTVEVITALPYYPEWRIHDSYRAKYWHREYIQGVTVYRCPLYVPAKVSGLKRMLHDFSFFLSSAVQWSKALFRRYDLVFCIYPPLPIGIFPLLYGLIHRKKIWLHIQDLQVDAAREFGIITNKVLLRLLESFERWMLRNMDMISTISEGMRERIASKGFEESKIHLLPNWVDLRRFTDQSFRQADLKVKYGFRPFEKVVLYSGNIGEKQGIDLILDVAGERHQEYGTIRYLIVGNGAFKSKLVDLVRQRGLQNIAFRDFVPLRELADLLNMADVHLVLQKKGASTLVMPSKLGAILACGGIAVISAEPESRLWYSFNNAKAAYLCAPEQPESFRDTLWLALSNARNLNREQIRAFAYEQFDQTNILKKFEHKAHSLSVSRNETFD